MCLHTLCNIHPKERIPNALSNLLKVLVPGADTPELRLFHGAIIG